MSQSPAVVAGPLTFGQMSVWRDIDDLPRDRWHEPNHVTVIELPQPTSAAKIESVLVALDTRHEGMRTIFDLENAMHPRQVLLPPLQSMPLEVRAAGTFEVEEKVDVLRRQPFDLTTDRPWRVLALSTSANVDHPGDSACPQPSRDSVSHVLFAKHHIAFDAWSVDVLTRDFLDLLRTSETVWDTSPRHILTAIADEQRDSSVWAARLQAAQRHFRAVYDTPPARFVNVAANTGVLQASVTSAGLHRSARQLAASLKVSVGTVLVTGVAEAIRRYTDGSPAVVGLMSSNRFSARWRDLITSMNQWIPIAVASPPGLTFQTQAEVIQRKSMAAYRLGMYDVDAVVPREPTVHINVISADAPGQDLEDLGDSPTIAWEDVFSSVGPRCYVRIFVGQESLVVKLRTNGLSEETVEGILRGIHEAVTAAAQEKELLTP